MSRSFTASDRSRLIKLAASMEKGSEERKPGHEGYWDEWLKDHKE